MAGALESGDANAVRGFMQQAISDRTDARTILETGLLAGMASVGDKFKRREIFLPDVLMAAKAMNAGMELLKPLLVTGGLPSMGKVVIGTVQGDLHDIGKNLVVIMLRGAGFDVIDLGYDVSPGRFIDAAESEQADVLGMSALLTTTMPVMKAVVDLADERRLRQRTKIVIGGASVSEEYARQIGADAYCFDGLSAVEYVKKCVERS
jgi:5-methyltetrahydrofolate--homocysteine methyltransferase